MVWDFLKYCYMRFRPSPFVLKCVCYLLESESQANIIWRGGVEKAPQTQIQSIVAQILCWFRAIVLNMKCLFPEVHFRLIPLPAWCVSAFIHVFSILMNFEGCRAEAGIPNPCSLCNVGMVCMELVHGAKNTFLFLSTSAWVVLQGWWVWIQSLPGVGGEGSCWILAAHCPWGCSEQSSLTRCHITRRPPTHSRDSSHMDRLPEFAIYHP